MNSDRTLGRNGPRVRARRVVALGAAAVLVMGLSACSGQDGDTALKAAQVNVTAKQEALAEAQTTAQESAGALCETGQSYVTDIDRYGDLLTQTAVTVGDVRAVGDDLAGGRDEVVTAAQEAQAAQEQVKVAEEELLQAQAALAELDGSTPDPEPSSTESESPAVQPASIDRVQQAESDFATTQEGIDDNSVLREAAQQFNSAVVALEMAWLQLFAESGCLSGAQQEQAQWQQLPSTPPLFSRNWLMPGTSTGRSTGSTGRRQWLQIEALQEADGLPQTGAMDKATSAALQAELACQGRLRGPSGHGIDRGRPADPETHRLLGWAGRRAVERRTDRGADAVAVRPRGRAHRDRGRGHHRRLLPRTRGARDDPHADSIADQLPRANRFGQPGPGPCGSSTGP